MESVFCRTAVLPSDVSFVSCNASAFGFSSVIHLCKALCLPLMCGCKAVTLALIMREVSLGPGLAASPTLTASVQAFQLGCWVWLLNSLSKPTQQFRFLGSRVMFGLSQRTFLPSKNWFVST